VVLSGRIEVKIGDEIVTLKQGESIHFNGTRPHGIRNVGNGVSDSCGLLERRRLSLGIVC